MLQYFAKILKPLKSAKYFQKLHENKKIYTNLRKNPLKSVFPLTTFMPAYRPTIGIILLFVIKYWKSFLLRKMFKKCNPRIENKTNTLFL